MSRHPLLRATVSGVFRPGIKRRLLAGTRRSLFLCVLVFAVGSGSLSVSAGEDGLRKVTAEASNGIEDRKWRYFLYLPPGYVEGDGSYPLYLWLHGRSLRGTDLEMLRRYGPPAYLEKDRSSPFVTVCPQLEEGAWEPESLVALLDECISKYHIDPARVLLGGSSLGPMGAWTFAVSYPDRFAALVPICAHGPAWVTEKVVDLPIRAIHGDADEIVPIDPHAQLIQQIRDLGGDAELLVVPGGDHGSVIRPLRKYPEIYDWALQVTRTVIKE